MLGVKKKKVHIFKPEMGRLIYKYLQCKADLDGQRIALNLLILSLRIYNSPNSGLRRRG